MTYNNPKGAAVAQWIRLAAHGQWVVGSNPIRAIDGVRKGIRPQFSCAPKTNQSQDQPAQKKAQSGFLTGYGDFNKREFFITTQKPDTMLLAYYAYRMCPYFSSYIKAYADNAHIGLLQTRSSTRPEFTAN